MASFSLTEKLAVTGAFLAMVAMAVGTEDDPGMIATAPTLVHAPRAAASNPWAAEPALARTAEANLPPPVWTPTEAPDLPRMNPASRGLPPNPVNLQPTD